MQQVTGYNRLTPLMAVRLAAPHTWPGPSVLTTAFGGVFAISRGYTFDPLIWCVLLVVAVLAQSAVNTLNDYADFAAGTDTVENSDDPTDAVLVYDNPNPRHVLILGICYMGVSLVGGLVVTWWSMSALPLVIGAVGAVFIVVYSWGKLPISYLPLGEIVSGVVMGCLIPLADVVVFAGHDLASSSPFALFSNFDWWGTILATAPFVIGIAMVMATQNDCDVERDRAVGRHTLPVTIGHRKAVILYRIVTVFWVATVLHFSFWEFQNGFWAAIVCILFGLGALKGMLTTPLVPEVRGPSMGNVSKANLFVNGAYVLAIMVSLI